LLNNIVALNQLKVKSKTQTTNFEVQIGTNEVQTIGIGLNSKFKGGGAGDMDLAPWQSQYGISW